MTTGYEILYIVKTSATEDKRNEINDKLKSIIESNGGEILLYKEIGLRDLATEFDKNTQGYYVQIQYEGNKVVLDEIANFMHITEDVLRHMNVTLESIQTNVSEENLADTRRRNG